MNFTNATPYAAGWASGFQRDGRELLIAIAKATFALPMAGEAARPTAVQLPLTQADEFVGEPGLSAPLRETDYAHAKPFCDVLFVGHAHAPAGTMVKRLQAGLRVGAMTKQLQIVGDRQWQKGVFGLGSSEPIPFAVMTLGHERAFGGTDDTRLEETGLSETFPANPVGRGYWRHHERIDGQPLPNLEEIGHPVQKPHGDYRPMALSPIGRHWQPRQQWAGTYDEAWLQHRAPFWPDDFDARYFQAAPMDQWIPYPQGGEEVVLLNLTPEGRRHFTLPHVRMPVTFIPYSGRDVTQEAVLDTVVIEPGQGHFTLTWRTSIALGRSVFDVKETIVGEMSAAWHRARRFPGKTYYASLAEAVAARRERGPAW